jgi:hypothetical protein
MFGFRENKTKNTSAPDARQLNLHAQFEAAALAEREDKTVGQDDFDDSDLQEEMIQQTLNRREWESKLADEEAEAVSEAVSKREDYENFLKWEAENKDKIAAEIEKFKKAPNPLPPVEATDDDLESDKPAYEYYGKWEKFRKPGTPKRKRK